MIDMTRSSFGSNANNDGFLRINVTGPPAWLQSWSEMVPVGDPTQLKLNSTDSLFSITASTSKGGLKLFTLAHRVYHLIGVLLV